MPSGVCRFPFVRSLDLKRFFQNRRQAGTVVGSFGAPKPAPYEQIYQLPCFQHLQQLSLEGIGARLTDGVMLAALARIRSLTDLSLRGCSQV